MRLRALRGHGRGRQRLRATLIAAAVIGVAVLAGAVPAARAAAQPTIPGPVVGSGLTPLQRFVLDGKLAARNKVTWHPRRTVPAVVAGLHDVPNLPAMADASRSPARFRRTCGAPKPGHVACLALLRTDISGLQKVRLKPDDPPVTVPPGYGPASLWSAYNLPSTTDGAGQTIAIVDAYDDPNAESDLAEYRAYYGLPSCTTANGCFLKTDEYGATDTLPDPDADWSTEISLDLDMVSAICPLCHIALIEAYSSDGSDLGTGVDTAVYAGIKYVSNSYGSEESQDDLADDMYFDHPGAAITVAAGDDGYEVNWPASSPYVTAVGGTSLLEALDTRGWAEIAWTGTGSGCSQIEPKPAWQTDTGCADRTVNDVSAIADPSTGVSVYDTYDTEALGFDPGFVDMGGTSAGAPIIASVYALAGTPAANTFPASYPYADPGGLNDITAGTNSPYEPCTPSYLCNAVPGYDGPTGLGTPDGVGAFEAP
jgi:Subtilase family